MRLAKMAKMNKRRLVGLETGCLRFWGCCPLGTQLHNLLYSNWGGNQQVRQTCPRRSLVVWKKGEKTHMRTARKAETVSRTILTDMCETGEIITFDKFLWSQNQSVNMRIIEYSKMILTWRKIWIAGPTPGFKIWGVLKKKLTRVDVFSPKMGENRRKKWDKITTFEGNCSIRLVLDDKKPETLDIMQFSCRC